MKVARSSWHYKVYNGWHVRKFYCTRETSYNPRQLDLCSYCRVVFVWAPLRWFIQGKVDGPAYRKPWVYPLALAAIAGLFAWWHFKSKGVIEALLLAGMIVATCVLAIGLILLYVWLSDHRVTPRQAWLYAAQSLPAQYIKAKKRHVCPLIQVEDEAS